MALSERYTLNNIKLVDECRVVEHAAVVIEHGTITYAGAQDRTSTDGLPVFDLGGWFLCAGYIDLQLNGAYGYDFTTQHESIPEVARRLPQYGVVAYLPTFISNPLPGYHQQLSATLSAQLGGQSVPGFLEPIWKVHFLTRVSPGHIHHPCYWSPR